MYFIKALPPGGIQVFAAVLHAHSMSRKIQLRHIRNGKEMAPIVLDRGFDFNYQEYRVLAAPVRILPVRTRLQCQLVIVEILVLSEGNVCFYLGRSPYCRMYLR